MPRASFILATHNRREVVLRTLAEIDVCSLSAGDFETIVVDNASTDGTADAIGDRFPHVRVIRQADNRGPCAKNAALPHARGRYIVFLDDDSYPVPRSTARMMHHFENDPRLGAVGFTVTLPD